ncbi:MAG: type III-A CRISPR-associated RAMP protein Csm3 [Anaerolineae bacterium]
MTDDIRVNLYGRVFIQGNIKAVTGLHIGGAAGALEIGGVDSPVIRDPLTNRPYVPGSSLRGKMRSLTEKVAGAVQNFGIGKGVRIHVCKDADEYKRCRVCPIFGVTGDSPASAPTRLIVRDVFLGDDSAKRLQDAQTDLPYSEVKWEATIDRVTSAAVPRQIERVPAGAVFEDFEFVYSIYDPADLDRLATVVEAMQLLEDDYLGGLGSRGGGKIAFEGVKIYARDRDDYGTKDLWDGDASSVARILEQKKELLAWARQTIPTP